MTKPSILYPIRRTILRAGMIILAALTATFAHAQDIKQIYERGEQAVNEQRFNDAIGYFYQIMNLYKQGVSDTVTCGGLLDGGTSCIMSNRYIEALEFYTLGIKAAEKYNQMGAYYKCINNVGGIYALFEDYERAIHYFNKAYQGAVQSQNEDALSYALTNLVAAYCKLGKSEEAKKYYQLQTRYPLKNKFEHQFNLLCNQAAIAFAEKNYNDAIYYYNKALEVANGHDLMPSFEVSALSDLGNSYKEQDKYDTALTYYNQAADIAADAEATDILVNTYKSIADTYEKLNDKDKAAAYKLKYVELSDSLFNQQQFNATKEKLSLYEEEMNEKHIFSLNDKIRKQFWAIVAISLLAIAMIIILLVIYHYNRKLHEAYRLLIEKNKQAMQRDEATLKQATEQLAAPTSTDTARFTLSEDKKAQLLVDIANVMNDEQVISDPEFTISELAQRVRSNPKYINQVINDAFHKNFKSYLIERRIRIASQRITDEQRYGNLTIQAIAASVGYNSPSTFVQAFKREMGMTPSLYKAMMKQMQTTTLADEDTN